MASGLVRFAAITNKDISQKIKQAVPEIYEEGDKIWFGSFYQVKLWLFDLKFIDETGEKVFCLQMQIKSCVTLFINKLKTKFNSFFYRIVLSTKRIHNSFLKKFPHKS